MLSRSAVFNRLPLIIAAIWALILFLNLPAVSANEPMPSFAEIQNKAQQGDVHSQYLLGSLYDVGLRIPKDLNMALKWYRKAAEQGHARAQFYLGRMCDLGEGVAENNKEALKWYRRAAEQGDVSSQFSLGAMYYAGDGVELDNKEAAKWFGMAARQDDADAQYLLATMYFDGDGVQQDYVKAYGWFHLSASNGSKIAADHRNRIGNIMTKEQRAEGLKLSKRLIEKE